MSILRPLAFLVLLLISAPVISAPLDLQQGEAALKVGDYAAAIALFKAAHRSGLDSSPESGDAADADKTAALTGWGDALAGGGNTNGAVRLYKKALALSPDSRPLLMRLRNLGIGP